MTYYNQTTAEHREEIEAAKRDDKCDAALQAAIAILTDVRARLAALDNTEHPWSRWSIHGDGLDMLDDMLASAEGERDRIINQRTT